MTERIAKAERKAEEDRVAEVAHIAAAEAATQEAESARLAAIEL